MNRVFVAAVQVFVTVVMSRLSSANYAFVVFMKRTGVSAGSGMEEMVWGGGGGGGGGG